MGFLSSLLARIVIFLAMLGPAQAATVLVTGANQGIGLEFVKEYAELGWTVIATHRRAETPESLATLLKMYPKTVIIERMDVADLAMIDAVAAKYRGRPIDVLLNNAGIVADLKDPKPQMFGSLDYPLFDTFMRTNVRGPLKISEAFFANVKASEQKRIVMISSLAGSHAGSTRQPGRIYYRASKSALNMAVTSLALATQADGVTVVSLHPGGVNVEKLIEFNRTDFMSPRESVSSMIKVIDGLTISDSGKFMDSTGIEQPW